MVFVRPLWYKPLAPLLLNLDTRKALAMNKWATKKCKPEELDETLEAAPAGWTVFTILPYGELFIVVFKRV